MRAKIKKVIFYSWWFIRFSFMTIVCIVISLPLRLSSKYKDLWVIAERPDEARDNGYWLYTWILEHHPEVNLRFVLSAASPDYQKMPRKEYIIEPDSMKHYIYYILSKYAISTHMHGVSPGKAFCMPFLPLMRRKKTIFLQHGVITNILPLRNKMDVVVTSSHKEAELVKRANESLSDAVRVIGLARFDNLVDAQAAQSRRTILIMPTFRKWLRDVGRLRDAEAVFTQSEYYQKWHSLLNNKELQSIARVNNMEILFYPHHELQGLARTFHPDSDGIVTIGTQREYDVQQLLIHSSILITDFSSILFDFAYMKKPILFYQFDKERFFGKHYKSSGEPYPFGDIFYDEANVVDEIKKTIKRKNSMKEVYQRDVDEFFAYRDQHNCERNFKAIKEFDA